MDEDERANIAARLRDAVSKARGYADFFGWPDRDVEEASVAKEVSDALLRIGVHSIHNLTLRGRGNDPPDCEAMDQNQDRIALELTELVDEEHLKFMKSLPTDTAAISSEQAMRLVLGAEWTEDKFRAQVSKQLQKKNGRYPHLKDAPYPGGYWVVLYTDEPNLPAEIVKKYVSAITVTNATSISKAFLLLSYDPSSSQYPIFEIKLDR
jgi:hypothetical protein